MQTATHATIGAALAGMVCCLGPEYSLPVVLGGLVLGSIIPDMPIAARMLVNKLTIGEHGLATPHKGWYAVIELSHSMPVNMILLAVLPALAFTYCGENPSEFVGAFFFGILMHIMIDMWTHSGPEYRKTDQSCLWPIYPYLTKKKAGEVYGLAEYRYDHGVIFRLKPFEKYTLLMSLLIALITISAVVF